MGISIMSMIEIEMGEVEVKFYRNVIRRQVYMKTFMYRTDE